MKYSILLLTAVLSLATTANSAAAENLLQWCVRSYPSQIDWCRRQYPGLVDLTEQKLATSGGEFKQETLSKSAQGADDIISSPTTDPKSQAPIEAIVAKSKSLSRKLLFMNVKQRRNVICAVDGPAWVLAELHGKYYAVNGLARGWRDEMKIYKAGKWHDVLDAGLGETSVFKYEESSRIIEIGNGLCPVPSDRFLDELSNRIDIGMEQAINYGHRYGL